MDLAARASPSPEDEDIDPGILPQYRERPPPEELHEDDEERF